MIVSSNEFADQVTVVQPEPEGESHRIENIPDAASISQEALFTRHPAFRAAAAGSQEAIGSRHKAAKEPAPDALP
jgi:hypothetical protein